MPKPRDIREKALLALFAHAAQKEGMIDDTIWNLALEPERDKITKISAKALKHQLSSLPKWATEFVELADLLHTTLKTYEYKAEARELRSLTKGVEELSAQFSGLNQLKEEKAQYQFCHQALALGSSLSEMKTTLGGMNFDFQALPKFTKAHEALIDLTQRVGLIIDPLTEEDKPTNPALTKASQEYALLREKALEYTQGTIDNLEQIDLALSQHLENFTPEQIGRVERSLLRLCTYEIIVLQLPKGIVINEALELARKFTTEDAVPLINAVLDKL